MTEKQFKKGMAVLQATFPSVELNLRIFWDLLCDLEDEIFEKAILKIVRTQTQIYPGTNIVALIRLTAVQEKYPTAGEAWENCLENSRVDYTRWRWIHPLVHKTSVIISVYEIRTSENPTATRAHFFKVYDDLLKKEQEQHLERAALPRGDAPKEIARV
jgi:hypothetical protein